MKQGCRWKTVPLLILNAASLSQTLLISFMTYRALRKNRSRKSKINPFRSHRVRKEAIKHGDHIYTWTPGFVYSHNGIYCGEDKVIHFTAAEKVISGSNPKPPTQCESPRCGNNRIGNGVFSSCLKCFSGGRSLYLYQYGVGTFEFFSKLRGGTCTIAESDPPEEVIHRAELLLKKGYESYNLVFNNCESFALYCKTGLVVYDHNGSFIGISGQVNSWFLAPLVVLLSSTVVRFIPNRVVAAVVAYGVHLLTRHTYDIAVRGDAKKVEVEDLVNTNVRNDGKDHQV